MSSRAVRIAVSVAGAVAIVAVAILLAAAVGGERDTSGRPLEEPPASAPGPRR